MHVARTNKANLLKVWLVAIGVAGGLVVVALLMGAQPVSGQPVAAQRYSITDLGTLPGGTSSQAFAFGINSRGQVVGVSITASSEFHAVLWTK